MPEGTPLRTQYDIYPNGVIKSEVLERGGQDCRLAVKMAEALGDITEDERTGPDCDRQEETVG